MLVTLHYYFEDVYVDRQYSDEWGSSDHNEMDFDFEVDVPYKVYEEFTGVPDPELEKDWEDVSIDNLEDGDDFYDYLLGEYEEDAYDAAYDSL